MHDLKLQKTSETSMEDMPHMVIDFDKIAELKLNYPDVFSRLKTMGSRMNSALLGIHLIFSAQSLHGMVDDSLFMMTDFKICSIMQSDVFTDVNNEVNWYPGRLNLQSNSYSEVQLLQLAYCCNEISDQNRSNYIWFFGRKSEKAELIDLIARYELD